MTEFTQGDLTALRKGSLDPTSHEAAAAAAAAAAAVPHSETVTTVPGAPGNADSTINAPSVNIEPTPTSGGNTTIDANTDSNAGSSPATGTPDASTASKTHVVTTLTPSASALPPGSKENCQSTLLPHGPPRHRRTGTFDSVDTLEPSEQPSRPHRPSLSVIIDSPTDLREGEPSPNPATSTSYRTMVRVCCVVCVCTCVYTGHPCS